MTAKPVFALEALEAGHGDALLLHYGTASARRLMVIDGGPAGVFGRSLGPRLRQLADGADGPLPISLLMVSHLDDDHINGVIDLLESARDAAEEGGASPWKIARLWHNAFEDTIGAEGVALAHRIGEEAGASSRAAEAAGMFGVSVQQGRTVRDLARRLGLTVNTPFKQMVMSGPDPARSVRLAGGVSLKVIAPSQQRLDALRREWGEQLRRMAAKDAAAALAAAFDDRSPFNLSSIVVLAKSGERTMLLTGDARGDDILAGLTAAGLLKKPPLHVDLLKLPHHGSDNNVTTDFFRQVTADHYVISGDGRHGNPEVPTLRMISVARGKALFTLHLTHRTGKEGLGPKLAAFFNKEKAAGKKYKVRFRAASALSLKVDLGQAPAP